MSCCAGPQVVPNPHVWGGSVVLCPSCGRGRYKSSGGATPTFTFGGEIASMFEAVGPRCAQAADLDLDGDLDVVVASEFDNHIAWYDRVARGGAVA